MRVGEHGDESVAQEQLDLEAVAGHGRRDREIGRSRPYGARGFVGGDIEDLDLRVGVLGHEVDEHRRKDSGGDRRQRRDHDAPVLAAAVRVETVHGPIDTAEQVLGDLEQRLAMCGEFDGPGGAHEQRDGE